MAIASILYGLSSLIEQRHGLDIEAIDVDGTPVSVYRPAQVETAPAVVIAHGFSGSRQLMDSFAMTMAQNGMIAISFDFLGHGRNRLALRGDVMKETGATAALVEETEKIVAFARNTAGSDGRVALLGHSMASDIIVRVANADPDIAAVVAVSMFSRQVTADKPRNLLMIVGALETGLIEHAGEMLTLLGGDDAQPSTTYGRLNDGTARRLVVAPSVEHVGVLYSVTSLSEAEAWLSGTFDRSTDGKVAERGPALLWLFGGLIALVWPLASWLPELDQSARTTKPLKWRKMILVILAPAALTPLLLWKAPWDVLPIQVADYLAFHFFVYGALTLVGLWLAGVRPSLPDARIWRVAAVVTGLWLVLLGLPIDLFVASFWPHAERVPLILLLAAGTLIYTIADSWLTASGRTGVGLLSKLAFIGSLAAAVALNFEALMFLAIIAPVIILFFVIYGLMGWWVTSQVRAPLVVGIANGVAFAWALGVTFPLLAS